MTSVALQHAHWLAVQEIQQERLRLQSEQPSETATSHAGPSKLEVSQASILIVAQEVCTPRFPQIIMPHCAT